MLYDLNTQFVDETGEPAKDGENAATVFLALRKALILDAGPTAPEEKLKRFDLLLKITRHQKKSATELIELTTDEAATLKKAADVYPTLIYGQLVHFLDQKQEI